jgi:hypothetical protein
MGGGASIPPQKPQITPLFDNKSNPPPIYPLFIWDKPIFKYRIPKKLDTNIPIVIYKCLFNSIIIRYG